MIDTLLPPFLNTIFFTDFNENIQLPPRMRIPGKKNQILYDTSELIYIQPTKSHTHGGYAFSVFVLS